MESIPRPLGVCDQRTSNEGGPDHLQLIGKLARRFGVCAESVLDYHDLGITKEQVRRHIERVAAEVARMLGGGAGATHDIAAALSREDVRRVWNSKKNLRYAAGSIMLTERFRDHLTVENRAHAVTCKILYEATLDSLDDLIDSESYSFADALDLMRHCLGSITARGFDVVEFHEELRARLLPEQRHLTDFLTSLVAALHEEIRRSPHGLDLLPALERLQENWILGQAFTMYQKDPTVDVRAFLASAERLPGPDADLTGLERLAAWISHTAAATVLDLCFVDELPSREAMEDHMTAWFYLDAVITLLNNVADVAKDLDDGIANLFLIARGGETVLRLRTTRGFQPTLTMDDYEAFLARSAEFSRRALVHARKSTDDLEGFYPFIELMIPIVMFSDERGIREDLLHAYLRFLAPALRGLPPAPFAAPTTPRGTRSGRIPSARTASS